MWSTAYADLHFHPFVTDLEETKYFLLVRGECHCHLILRSLVLKMEIFLELAGSWKNAVVCSLLWVSYPATLCEKPEAESR